MKEEEGRKARGQRGLVGSETERERERVRVWREDREIDRITGFKSRTDGEMARDKERRRVREGKSALG